MPSSLFNLKAKGFVPYQDTQNPPSPTQASPHEGSQATSSVLSGPSTSTQPVDAFEIEMPQNNQTQQSPSKKSPLTLSTILKAGGMGTLALLGGGAVGTGLYFLLRPKHTSPKAILVPPSSPFVTSPSPSPSRIVESALDSSAYEDYIAQATAKAEALPVPPSDMESSELTDLSKDDMLSLFLNYASPLTVDLWASSKTNRDLAKQWTDQVLKFDSAISPALQQNKTIIVQRLIANLFLDSYAGDTIGTRSLLLSSINSIKNGTQLSLYLGQSKNSSIEVISTIYGRQLKSHTVSVINSDIMKGDKSFAIEAATHLIDSNALNPIQLLIRNNPALTGSLVNLLVFFSQDTIQDQFKRNNVQRGILFDSPFQNITSDSTLMHTFTEIASNLYSFQKNNPNVTFLPNKQTLKGDPIQDALTLTSLMGYRVALDFGVCYMHDVMTNDVWLNHRELLNPLYALQILLGESINTRITRQQAIDIYQGNQTCLYSQST